jgi:branched-chain amino acid transport system permease protein
MHGAPPRRQFLALGALVLAGFVLPHLLPDYFLYIGNVLMTYLVLAIGLDLLLGWTGQFAFAHVAFYGLGIYGTALLHMRLGIPFVFGMPIAAAIAALIGLLIALPATRLRTVYLALATFAFAECAQWVFRTWDSVTKGPDGLRMSAANVFGYSIGNDRDAMPVLAIITALVLAATLYLVRSKLGRAFCAIRDSEHVAAASGIDVRRVKVLAFVVSAFYAGVAGGMYTLYQSYVHPDGLGVWTLVLLLTMVVVGGSGSVGGMVLGVLLIGILPEVLRAAPRGLLVWQEFAYGLILILAIMFMPRGIWGLFAKSRSA